MPDRPVNTAPSVDDGGSQAAQAQVTICNNKGLHARASAQFVTVSERFSSDVTVTFNGEEASATSILDLMMLAAAPGAVIHITARGTDAQAAVDALVALVADGFGEDDPADLPS